MMRTPATERRQHVIAEVEHCLGWRSRDDICHALGYALPDHLDRLLHRAGREDLVTRLHQADRGDDTRDDTGRFILHTLGRIR
ncbi:hypothetical protein [Propionibacterium freudenreichii]|uniref:hypothetical protein n=1 Tax=Propionibacterium freudenreichii TaxID=1744 RepID=UPI0038578F2D